MSSSRRISKLGLISTIVGVGEGRVVKLRPEQLSAADTCEVSRSFGAAIAFTHNFMPTKQLFCHLALLVPLVYGPAGIWSPHIGIHSPDPNEV
jgi:hypothetical protein